MTNYSNYNLIQEIRSKGIIKIKKFFTNEEILEVKKIININKKPKAHPDTIYPITNFNYLVKLIKFDIKKIKNSIKLQKIAKNKNLQSIANSFFNNPSELTMIDAYYSKISNKNLLDWHCDEPFTDKHKNKVLNHHDNRKLKIFIYLTRVYKDNGCMSYIPGSHNFVYQLKKLIYEKKIPFLTLKYLKDLKFWLEDKQNYELIKKNIADSKLLNNFLEILARFDKKNDSVEFDYEMEEGDAVIFDENGFHKGTKTLFSDRMVLRYHYTRQKKI